MGVTQRTQTISTKLQGIANKAQMEPELTFTSLAHLVDVDFLREAFRRIRKSGAPGTDGVKADTYASNLAANLEDLHERLRTNSYEAGTIKRVWIPKSDGKERPIGIIILEDKIVQKAVTMLLETIYEQEFYDFSMGFRVGRSQHQALQYFREKCLKYNINWLIDADVSGFFDNLSHQILREFIQRRINDSGLMRLIGKWLNAGVVEKDTIIYPVAGSPQGGVISPMLSNVYMHYVLDDWFVKVVQPKLKGKSFILRFADDFVIGCEREDDVRRVMKVLPKRFNRFELTIHPTKTSLINFRKPGKGIDREETGSFDFLGFTHYWGKSRRGHWIIKRKTAKRSLNRSLKALWEWCRDNRHESLKEQYQKLCQKVRGHIEYFGIIGNYDALKNVVHETERAWRYWLSRRSQTSNIPWKIFKKLLDKMPLPKARIMHQV